MLSNRPREAVEVWQFDVYEDITGRYRWRLFAGSGRRCYSENIVARGAADNVRAHAQGAELR
jgi:uncharacterized protein YegP (UPF0339 family)